MKLVLSGYSAWLVPIFFLLVGGFFALWITQPVQEGFEHPQEEKKTIEKKEVKKEEKKEVKKEVKERFEMPPMETLSSDWRHQQLPQSMEPYHGTVTGYNCGLYSEFALGYAPPSCDRSQVVCKKHSEDYLFPDLPRYNSRMPHLEMCEDEPQILLEKDALAMKKKSCEAQGQRPGKVENIDEIIRPQYLYHRGNGTGTTLVGFGNEY